MSVVIEENPGGDGNTPKVTPAGGGNPGGEPAKTFTQAELDGIVNDRLTRERKKYDGFDDLKRKAGEFDKLADAQKSEAERLTGQITDLTGQLTQAQQRERSYALRDAIEDAVGGEKLTLAAPIGRVLLLIDGEAVEWSEDGKPKNAAAILKGLVRTDPYLFAARRAPIGDGGAGREGGVGGNVNDMIRRAAGRA